MKIRLTKDLPGAKAGEVFEDADTNIANSHKFSIGGTIYDLYYLEGWYEEVKEPQPEFVWYVDQGNVFAIQKCCIVDKDKLSHFRTKESAEKYRDALKETYGKEIGYTSHFVGFNSMFLEFRGKPAMAVKNLVDAINDRVQ